MIGTKVAHYEITAHLGSGGMGDVYQATDLKLKRRVAIKLLPAEFSSDAERLSRFRREAQLLASLNHSNIAHIYGLEESGDRRCIVMELVEGEPLQARLKRGPIPVDEALGIAKQICEALEAAHEKAVIHRDLKPGNVMLTGEGKVKVLDFGLAKAFEQDASTENLSNSPTLMSGASMPGVILGTAAYMSPEQARGSAVDCRSDIFAFGVVFYEMLTGKQAFQGDTVSDVLASVLKTEPNLALLPGSLPRRLPNILSRCLEKNPKQRWHAVADIRIELENLDSSTTPEPVRPGSFAKLAAVSVMTLGLGILVGAYVWSLRQDHHPAAVTRFSFDIGKDIEFTNAGRSVVAVSPNGQNIVFVANNQLYLRSMQDAEPHPIKGTFNGAGVYVPFFSPDGESIGFFVYGGGSLKKIPINGGTPITIADVADAPFGAIWILDGSIVFATAKGIQRVSSDGGTPQVLIPAKEGEMFATPQLLPDGTHLLFTVATGADEERWVRALIVVQDLKTGERKTIVQGGSAGRYLPPGWLIYTVSGSEVVAPFDLKTLRTTGRAETVIQEVGQTNCCGSTQLAVSDDGVLAYVEQGANVLINQPFFTVGQEGHSDSLGVGEGAYHPAISPDGTWMAFDKPEGVGRSIWIYDFAAKTQKQLTFEGVARGEAWTPDSSRVTFELRTGSNKGIFWTRADGAGKPEELLRSESAADTRLPVAWSNDGSDLLYISSRQLWTYSRKDSTSKRLIASPVLWGATFSADGHWFVYDSDESGTPDVWVQPFPPTGQKHKISIGGGHHPLWSRDGKTIYYLKTVTPESHQLMAVPVQTSPTFTFGAPEALQVEPLAQSLPIDRAYDIAKDGKLIVGQPAGPRQRTHSINVVINWFEDLKKLAPGH